MGKLKAKIDSFRFKGVLAIVLIFALISAVLFVELSGVRARHTQNTIELLPSDKVVTKELACENLDKTTLLIYSNADKASAVAYEQFDVILNDMKLGTDRIDLSVSEIPDFNNYSLVIVLFSDLSYMGNELVELCQWVYNGGNVLFPLTIDKNAYSSAIENKIGIEASYGYSYVGSMYINEDFMLGGGKAFAIEGAYESARTVQLNPKTTKVHVAIGKKDGVPLIWEASYGEGKFVLDNFGMCDKAYRGFFSASISLFFPVFAYPVINGSVFYLDDFPSQIPEGSNYYINRDFGTTVRDFYINTWWPDMMNLADKYNLKYTGLAIECYDDAIDGTTDANPDTATFLNFGNMLLRKGGELGYHGYNHQPLAIGREYYGIYDYKAWQNEDAIVKSFSHLIDFCDRLFPDANMSVYVPPSNLLASEGREILLNNFSQIKTLSGIYLPDDVLDFALLQEFEVDENGVVDQPRIVSGCSMDDFMAIGALSELNFHYVNNHFTHPDDALDPDRGAELGWRELYKSFDAYMNWLYTSAPNLRNFKGSELSAAVQRFVAVTPHIEITENSMKITIDNFYDDAQFMMRFNEKKPGEVVGGTLTHLTGDIYILEATEGTVTVSLK